MSEPLLRPGARGSRRATGAADRAHLEVVLAPGTESRALPAGRHALATIRYGECGPTAVRFADGGLDLCVSLPQLGERRQREVWSSAEEPCSGESAGVRFARTSELLLGALESPGHAPEEETFEAYRRVLSFAAGHGVHLVRTWNVVPRFHDVDGGLDRYKQFCRGRARAFEAHHGPEFERHLCASSAVGSSAGPALVYILATRLPGQHRENPRQLSAYRYPAQYGPRSPSFARATRAPATLEHMLLLSGTASIVGHASRHQGDITAQTAETLRNLRVLVGEPRSALAGRMPLVKVFLRDAGDRDVVRRSLAAELGARAAVIFLRADICRPELLVEIEGFVVR